MCPILLLINKTIKKHWRVTKRRQKLGGKLGRRQLDEIFMWFIWMSLPLRERTLQAL